IVDVHRTRSPMLFGRLRHKRLTVTVNDLNATILHLLGIDHRRLTYRYQGRDFRLTDVHGHVMHDLIA
ncbi:MAG: DUF1501 domain-containing protein, partial [Planctomycetota bacterium]